MNIIIIAEQRLVPDRIWGHEVLGHIEKNIVALWLTDMR